MRESAYKSIAAPINIDGFEVMDVKNKIKYLDARYAQEIKKTDDSKKSGTGSDPFRFIIWLIFQYFCLLYTSRCV